MILISNDDGPASPGLHALIQELSSLEKVSFSIPERQRSGASMSITFHKPLRIRRLKIKGVNGYVISGSPVDAILMAFLKLFDERPKVVVSGINIGDNTGLQDIYASGTVAAAIQASLMGIPALAFSMEIGEKFVFSAGKVPGNFIKAAKIARTIVEYVIENGLPENVDLLNVNFPFKLNRNTPVVITWPAPTKYDNFVIERIDPRGKPYYWIWGRRLAMYPKGSDAYALFNLRAISITPLTIDLCIRKVELNELVERVKASIL